MTDFAAMANTERKALYTELQGLSEQEWSTMTACDPWTVRQLVAHLTALGNQTAPNFFSGFVRSGFNFNKSLNYLQRIPDAHKLPFDEIHVQMNLGELSPGLESIEPLIPSLVAYRKGNLLQALAKYPSARTPASNQERVYLAALLLSVGQVDRAHSELAPVLNASAGSGGRWGGAHAPMAGRDPYRRLPRLC